MAKSNPLDEAKQIQTLLIDYAKQETIHPLKSLTRYLSWGLVGALMVFLGVMFVALATLRLFQTFDAFEGDSWASLVPYAATLGVLLLAVVFLVLSMFRAKKKVLS